MRSAITSDIAASGIEAHRQGHWLIRGYIACAIVFGAACLGILFRGA